MTQVKKTLGQHIQELRRAKGLTQEQLATLAGIDAGYLAHLENNRRFGTAQTIMALAKSLEVNPPHSIFAVLDEQTTEPTEAKAS
jgi:transcriptional regulator with XRE-family HTH domain